jgi:CubicO group peptidase (beta-lactamase class C family)
MYNTIDLQRILHTLEGRTINEEEVTMYDILPRIMRSCMLIGLVCVLLVPAVLLGQDKAEKIDELLTMYNEYDQFNGTVLIAENGEIILKKGYGFADFEWEIENQPEMKFLIGSITKQFTAMLVMQLVQAGKIKLDASITTYLSDYRKDNGDRITIHNLLTHTTGIPNLTNIPGFWSDSIFNRYTLDYLVHGFCAGDLEFEPNTEYRYSNSNYIILGAIIEQVTGQTFEQVLHENILEPLDMENSGMGDYTRMIAKRASGYTRDGLEIANASQINMSNIYAAGAMYSTVEDLFLWDRALYTDRLLNKKYKKMMFTPFLGDYAYGCGVYKRAKSGTPGFDEGQDSVLIISHTGGLHGFTSVIQRLVEDKHTIILFDNTNSGALGDIVTAIRAILYDKSYEMPRRSIANEILPIILENGVEAAIEHYHTLRDEHPDEYDFSEIELNNLGYILLGMNRVADAIALFELNVEMYSGGYNTYDSLAEAYMTAGERNLAIENYAQSLKLNPDNANAVRMLQRIFEQTE